MILQSLRVTHWRNLLNPTEVGPFAEGLNVIHAPNGTGKSSLFEAMRRTLFDAHLVSGKEIEAVRPWGRSLAPQVTVEFFQGSVRYRIEKTFLDGPNARLLRFEDGQFAPLADGRNADSKLREILAVTDVPGRGLSKQEHWGLAQVLWAPQGALILNSLSPSVLENLRSALGVQLTGEGGSRLEELIEEQFLSFFTKGGKPRTGKDAAPILALESEFGATTQDRQRLLIQQQSFEEAARAVEDARESRAQARREADALREPLVQTRRLAESYQRMQGDLQQKRQAEQSAKDRFDSIGKTIDLIANARQEVAGLKAQIQREEGVLGELASELKTGSELASERRRIRDEARQRRASMNDLTAEVEDARAFLGDIKARQTLVTKLDKLKDLQASVATEKESRGALVAPDDKTIKDVRKCLATREKAEMALQASLIRLTVRPLKPTTVTRGSSEETKSIASGEEATFTGSPGVSIDIEGFGSIHAAGPETDVDARREEVTEADKKLAKLTQPFATQDPDRLQLSRDQAKDLDQKIKLLENQIGELLGDETVDGLQAQSSELDARILERTSRFPTWKDQPPVVSDLQSTLEEQRKEIENVIQQAEDAFEQAQAGAQAVEKRHTKTEAGVKMPASISTPPTDGSPI